MSRILMTKADRANSAGLPTPVGTLSWGAAVTWFTTAVLVAGVGTYLAYVPFSSDAWRFGRQP